MLADFVVDITTNNKIMRYCPYFINICEQVPKLANLTYLRIHGFSSHEEEESVESAVGGKLITTQAPLPDILLNIAPPSSLKTLIIELPSERIPYNAASWLFKPQNTYALENIFIKFDGEEKLELLVVLGQKFDTPMPRLLNFRFECPDDGSLLVVSPRDRPDKGFYCKFHPQHNAFFAVSAYTARASPQHAARNPRRTDILVRLHHGLGGW